MIGRLQTFFALQIASFGALLLGRRSAALGALADQEALHRALLNKQTELSARANVIVEKEAAARKALLLADETLQPFIALRDDWKRCAATAKVPAGRTREWKLAWEQANTACSNELALTIVKAKARIERLKEKLSA